MPLRRLQRSDTHSTGTRSAKHGAIRATAARWLARCSWGYLLIAGVTCIALWTLADRWWPLTLLLFGPRWILLLPLAVLLPAAAVLRPFLLAPLVAAALIVLVPLMGLRLGWRSWLLDDDTASVLRVVTLNTGGSEGLALELPFRIREWRADLVALQECGTALSEAVRGIEGWYHHVAGQLCVLSRHPIREARSTDWNDFARIRETGLGGSSQGAQYLIDTPGQPIRFVNLHLETARKGLEGAFDLDFQRIRANTTLRAAESRRTREWLGDADGSLIIAGDFNMPVESAIYRKDWSQFGNAFSDAGTGFGTTKDNGWIQVRIDHIVMGAGWRTTHVVAGPVLGLDHRPVIAELRWMGPPGVSRHDALEQSIDDAERVERPSR